MRLLHGSLRGTGGDSTQRILTVLERPGFEWVFVPAGEFVVGEGTTQRRVYLGGYWMGKYPVTNAQFARFVEENAAIGFRVAAVPQAQSRSSPDPDPSPAEPGA